MDKNKSQPEIFDLNTSEEFQEAVHRCLSVLYDRGVLQLSEIILTDKNEERDTRLGASKKEGHIFLYEKPFKEHKRQLGENRALWQLAQTILHEQYHVLNGAGEIEAEENATIILKDIT